MSSSEDEQYEHLIDAQHPNPDRDNLGEFNGFDSTTRLQYRVLSDSENDCELIPEL